MVVACYLADPLGPGLLPLRFWVLEDSELGALDRQGLGRRALLSISVFPHAPSSPNHGSSRGRRWPQGWGGRAKQRDLNTACSISPVLRPFRVAFRSGIEKGALVAGPAGARLRAGRRAPGPPLGLGSPRSRGWRSSPGYPLPPPTSAPPASVPPGESRRWEGSADPHPAAPTRPPPAAAAVAMRCCETPVNKLCLDSGARAQGLFA